MRNTIVRLCGLTAMLLTLPASAETTSAPDLPLARQVIQRNAQEGAEVKVAGAAPAPMTPVEVKAELGAGLRGKATDGAVAAHGAEVAQWNVFETAYESAKAYTNAFVDVEVNVVFSQGAKQWKLPAFWAGGSTWKVRFAPPAQGKYTYRVECSDKGNADLNGQEQPLQVTGYAGANPLLKHGFVTATAGKGYFEHADGTPFLWLGDTWWKCLCKRITWEGFQELTADRKAKGFSVVQIICGPYPDEGFFKPSWENEGGQPYLAKDLRVLNPKYFEYADRRLKHLVDSGLVPAIVGAWGRGDCNSMEAFGAVNIKRHWRYLIARYGAYPVMWILAGEIADETKWGQGPWAEVAKYVRENDPYKHPLTCHTGNGRRGAEGDISLVDYDMVGGSHDEREAVANGTLTIVTSACAKKPAMPVLVGETCYEGHMQQGFGTVQRHVFWRNLLSGAAGHTYGTAGVWHAGVEGDHGNWGAWGGQPYDWTTWKEGLNYPGSTQLGLGKKLLEQYPWWRFEPHPEWAPGCHAAGIPGEVRFIYLPRRGIYNWSGFQVKGLEPDVPYRAFFFDPASGRRFDRGHVMNPGQASKPFEGHTQPLLFEDRFEGADASAWKDYGTPTRREGGRLVGGKGMLTILEKIGDTNLMVSAEANSDAEAGLILRFHSPDHYLVALYTPHSKAIYIHDRKNGAWGDSLGRVDVPQIGPRIRLTAAACGEYAAMVLTDGQKTFSTPTVKVQNTAPGKAGVWLFQIGERQAYGAFAVSRAQFAPAVKAAAEPGMAMAWSGEWQTPNVPSPQDWVLVLERGNR